MDAVLETLLSTGSSTVSKLVRDAYQAGLDAGRRQGLAMIQEAAATFLKSDGGAEKVVESSATAPENRVLTAETGSYSLSGPRRPRGSVRPAVIDYLRSGETGRPGDIARATGQNENSIRGKLNALAGEGLAEKEGDIWYASAKLMQSVKAGDAPSDTEDAPT